MHRRLVRMIAGPLAAVILLAGCASTSTANLSPTEQRLMASTDRFNETVGAGALAGALLGAVLGAALAGSENRGQGALAGAALGGMAGAGAGYYVATQNRQYATREQAMAARIEAAQRETESYREIAQLSRQVAAENEMKLASLRQRYSKGQITAEQYRREAESARLVKVRLDTALAEAEKVRDQMGRDAQHGSRSESRALRAQQEQLAEHVDVIRDAQARLARGLGQVPG